MHTPEQKEQTRPLPKRFIDLTRALETRPILGVTCRGKTDGGGAQIHAIMSAQIFARTMGVPYFHTALRLVEHAPADPQQWAEEWEHAFGLANGYAPPDASAAIVSVDDFINGYDGPPPILEREHYHEFCHADPDQYLALRDEFRSSCRLVRNDRPSRPVAAVHIRRGDIAQETSEFAHRLTSNENNAAAIKQIQKNWPGIDVRIFSQGEPDDFSDLPEGCSLYLDTDVFETLGELINADVLVTAWSSFSYIAGLLSRGTVIYQPAWHKPLSSWKIRSKDGTV